MAIPPPTQTDTPSGKSNDERKLLDYCHELWEEGRNSRESFRSPKDIELDRKTYRGGLRPKGQGTGERVFSLNIVQAFVDRMVAQLTDNRPIMRVEAINAEMNGMANVVEKYASAVVWEESRAQRQLFRIGHTSAIESAAGAYTSYSNARNMIHVEMLYQDQISVHRGTREAAMVDEAESVGVQRNAALSWVRERFPFRGTSVKADVTADDVKSRHVIDTPLDQMIGRAGTKQPGDTIPMAAVKELYFIDRESRIKGKLAFPRYRRVVFTHDVILDDGVNPWFDGIPPVDIYDWAVDPESLWGMSATSMMRLAQIAFNEIMDGTIQNQITLNMVNLIMDSNSLDSRDMRNMQKMKNVNILSHRRNAKVQFQPPPPFGRDQVAIAREIFSYLQAVMGVTDVTLGESPGSLQSGLAIEGLQESANLMTRARASRLEDFISRVGQKIVSRIIQFVDVETMKEFLGDNAETTQYGIQRAKYFMKDGQPLTLEEKARAMRLLRFAIVPGSSAPGSKQARAQAMLGLHLLPNPLVSGQDVLEAADFRNAKETISRARSEASLPLLDGESKGTSPGLLQQTPPIFTGR